MNVSKKSKMIAASVAGLLAMGTMTVAAQAEMAQPEFPAMASMPAREPEIAAAKAMPVPVRMPARARVS